MIASAKRAIAVRQVLGDAGLPWSRMSVAGWGEHRPAVVNNAGRGTEANRRVEIFLTPSTWVGPSATAEVPTDGGGAAIDPIK